MLELLTTELTTQLLDRVAVDLARTGFRRRQQSFCKETAELRLCFHLAFVRHPTDVDVTVDVAVRHHAVEDRLNVRRVGMSVRMKKETATVGVELGNWVGSGQHRWTVTGINDISVVAQDILTWFERHGVPFLDRFSSLTETLHVLEEDGREARLICPLSDHRANVRAVLRELVHKGVA